MPVSELQDALRIGLAVVSEIWHHSTKSWVTSVAAADIDSDGDIEVLAGSRDGRVHVLTRWGDLRWDRIVGNKSWVGTLAVQPESSSMAARMLIGNREGMIFALDKDGKIVSPDGKLFAPGRQDWATEPDQEKTAYWLKSEQVIRQVIITEPTSTSPSMAVAGSEDRRVYALDAESGKLLWTFATQGPVRAICAADVNGDGEIEILAGSGDHYLYLLNSQGRCLHQHLLQDRQIYTIFAADIDHDQQTEILVGTDAKDLLVLTPDFTRKWSHAFSNRLLCLQVADLDNDGHNEIIAGSEDQHLYILDHQGNRLWQHHLGAGIFSLYAIDFDHDGQIELLVGSEDTRLHVLRIRLIRQLSRKIRRQYQQLGKPAPESLTYLSPAEQALLRDILDEERPHTLVKPATLEHAHERLVGGEHLLALTELLRLQQQKVQLRWCKDKPGHIRALYLGDISGDQQREVVIGSAEGLVQAFSAAGRNLWQLRLSGQILALQTGYLDHRKWQDILACSSDHHIYVISGTKKSITRTSYMNEWMSSFYLLAQERRSTPTVIVGTEDKKLCFYGRDLATPIQTISTPQGIKIVAAYDAMQAPRAPGEQIPEVIAGSLENTVTAYSRHGRLLWNYHTHDRVLAIAIKDLDGDGRVEIIIGSEDRNVHVLSNDGKLKWRYFTEHRVIAIDAYDLDHDGAMEVLAGCGDGKLYVLSAQGDLLWSYQTNDRIRVVRAEDIDDDGHVEIALGSEDRLELLSVIDQEEVSEQIAVCWQALLQDRNADDVITTLLTQQNPLLRAFALRKFAERANFAASDMLTLKDLVKDGARQVRLSLTYAVIHRYSVDPEQATALLNQLSTSWDRALRVAFVAQLPALTQQNWELGLEYLERFLRNQDRFVRRAVIRQITQLIPTVPKSLPDALFQLVLLGLNDEESRWIRQESARAFARFLDRYHKKIILYLYYFITNCGHHEILHLIAFYTRNPQAARLFSAMSALLTHLHEANTQSRIDDVVNGVLEALAEIRTLAYGQDSWLLYREFARLLSLHTIEDIADYQCGLHLNQFSPHNEYVPLTLHILERFDIITRLLTIYLHRTALNDQLNSLLEANAAIEHLQEYLEQQYAGALPGENIVRLPDRRLFEITLKQWSATIKTAFGELSGRPDLHATLKTTSARREEEVTVQLLISNRGRSSANQVKTTLLDSGDFTVIGPDSLEIGPIFPQEAVEAEFTIRPRDVATLLNLAFETVYYEEFVNGKSDSPMKWLPYEGHLELTAPPQEFKHIPNPYSTGTPTRDKNMFYGRANDIAFLKDNLTRTEAKSVIVLYGQRRSGKTTLLRHLVNTSVLGEHIPVLIDMQEEEYKITVSKFLYHVAHYIYQALRKKDMQLPRPEKAEFTSDPTFAFNLFLDEVEAHLSGQKIVLLLDEFEVLETQVEKKQLEAEIFPYLRSLMQHRQSLNFVLSGTHEMGQLLRGYWSVFFNIAHHHRLSRLAPQDTEDLITRPVAGSLEYEAHAIQKIRMLTGDQPYLIHLVCRSLIDLCNSRHKAYVTIHDVNTVQQDVMQTGQFHFDWIWDQITVEERMALSAIAEGRKEGERLISFSEIEDLYRQYHLPLKRGVLLAAIKRLADLDVVEDDSTQMAPERKRYRISVGLIGKWLRKEKALESLRQQLT